MILLQLSIYLNLLLIKQTLTTFSTARHLVRAFRALSIDPYPISTKYIMSSPARPRRAAVSRSIATAAAAAQAEPGSSGSDLSDAPEEKKVTKESPRKKMTPKVETDVKEEEEEEIEEVAPKGKAKAKSTTKRAKAEPKDEEDQPKKKPRVSKASILPPADLALSLHPTRKGYPVYTLPDLPAGVVRNGGIQPESSSSMPMLVGAHTSIAGGPATALLKAGMLGANGLAMFTKSQRQWKSKDFEPEAVERFRDLMKSKEEGGQSFSSCSGKYLVLMIRSRLSRGVDSGSR
jgi:AP endonuclease-1